MQKSFFRAKQPGQCRAQKKSPAQAICLASAGQKIESGASAVPGRGHKKKESVADLCL